MTYSTGSIIRVSDYNNFTANVNAVWSTAYGQTSIPPSVLGNPVRASQWATLNTTIASIGAHQGTTITSRSNPQVGNIIAILNNLGTDITSINTNMLNAATQGTQYTAWTGTASKTTATGSTVDPWTITFTDTVAFANTTALSTFFDCGGTVKIQFSKTSTGTNTDPEWNTLVNTVCGSIVLTGVGNSKTINGTTYLGTNVVGGTGTPTILTTAIGVKQLTTTPTIVYKQFDSGTAYSSNYVQVSAVVTGSNLVLTTVWSDAGDPFGADISGGTATTGIAFGTAPTTVVTYTPPETTHISNTWGTPTVASSVA